MFEKRYKSGEDNFVAKSKFICVTDGVGGWVRKMVDPGLFTKEYVVHIAEMYDSGDYSNLKELLDNASKKTKAKGSSTCVMASLSSDSPTTLNTCNLGDSGYMLFRPIRESNKFDLLFKSKS